MLAVPISIFEKHFCKETMPLPPLIISAVSADLGARRHFRSSSDKENNRSELRDGNPKNNRLTALLVDGVPFCRMIEKAFLRSVGVETHDLDNGQDAVTLLASGANFNLIILDIMSPVLGGVETARQIRAMGVCTKMIGTTAFLDDRGTQDFLDAGVDQVIEKPLSPDKLVPILIELYGQI